jgi:DNA replication protein DnaC
LLRFWQTYFANRDNAVRYFRTADLLLELKLAKADGSFRKWQRQIAAFSLLILENWLRGLLSVDQARNLLDLLNERYRKTS